jgi:hypothetical protein
MFTPGFWCSSGTIFFRTRESAFRMAAEMIVKKVKKATKDSHDFDIQ